MGEKRTGETHREEARLSLVIRINQAYLKRDCLDDSRRGRSFVADNLRVLPREQWERREKKKKHPLKMYAQHGRLLLGIIEFVFVFVIRRRSRSLLEEQHRWSSERQSLNLRETRLSRLEYSEESAVRV